MNSIGLHFAVFVLVALLAFLAILKLVTCSRTQPIEMTRLGWLSMVVVLGGMVFAKVGNNLGLPWWVYYTVPALVTFVLPPQVLRMSWHETWLYVVLAFLSSPIIHIAFSALLDWHEFLPCIWIPYLFGP